MSAISLRLPNSIHSRVKHLAKDDGVSVNQFITVALTEKLSVMNAKEYFEEKAKRGTRDTFDKILSKVPKRAPLEFDKK
jgi:hypothetical protein